MTNRHQSFVLNGRPVSVKAPLKRKFTPNFVNEWAEQNGVDLVSAFNPEIAKRKARQAVVKQEVQVHVQESSHEVKHKLTSKDLNRRMTISRAHLTGTISGVNSLTSSNKKPK